MSDFVTTELCEEKNKRNSDRFARDLKRLEDNDKNIQLLNENVKLLTHIVQKHENYIDTQSKKPQKNIDNFLYLLLGAVITYILNTVM